MDPREYQTPYIHTASFLSLFNTPQRTRNNIENQINQQQSDIQDCMIIEPIDPKSSNISNNNPHFFNNIDEWEENFLHCKSPDRIPKSPLSLPMFISFFSHTSEKEQIHTPLIEFLDFDYFSKNENITSLNEKNDNNLTKKL